MNSIEQKKNTPSATEAWVCSSNIKSFLKFPALPSSSSVTLNGVILVSRLQTPNHLPTLNCPHSVACHHWQGRVLCLLRIWGMLCRHPLTKTRLFSTRYFDGEGGGGGVISRLFVGCLCWIKLSSSSISPEDGVALLVHLVLWVEIRLMTLTAHFPPCIFLTFPTPLCAV